MANIISLKNCKRFERHCSQLNMRFMKASVEIVKLADAKRETNADEFLQDKTLTAERQ